MCRLTESSSRSTTLEIKDSIISQSMEISQVKESVNKLSSLVEVMLENNTFLARRLAMLEERPISHAPSILDPSTHMSAGASKDVAAGGLAAASSWNQRLAMESPEFVQGQTQAYIGLEEGQFEEILQHSRPYRKALAMLDEKLSSISAGERTGTWSVLSGLSLSQISSLTLLALPIYPQDITNADAYSFGMAETGQTMNEILVIRLGVEQIHATRRRMIALQTPWHEAEDVNLLICRVIELNDLADHSYRGLLERLDDLKADEKIERSLLIELKESLNQALRLFGEAYIKWYDTRILSGRPATETLRRQ